MASTRQQVREQLVTLFTGAPYNEVLGHAPLVFGDAVDKVLCIYSDRTHHDTFTADAGHDLYAFWLETYVKRTGAEADEDTLDALHEDVRSTIKANQGDALWAYLSLEEDSDAIFAEVSGVPYRIERHRLVVTILQN